MHWHAFRSISTVRRSAVPGRGPAHTPPLSTALQCAGTASLLCVATLKISIVSEEQATHQRRPPAVHRRVAPHRRPPSSAPAQRSCYIRRSLCTAASMVCVVSEGRPRADALAPTTRPTPVQCPLPSTAFLAFVLCTGTASLGHTAVYSVSQRVLSVSVVRDGPPADALEPVARPAPARSLSPPTAV